jgi:hypothetical protein
MANAPARRERAQLLRQRFPDPQAACEAPRHGREAVRQPFDGGVEQEDIALQAAGTFLCAKGSGEIEKWRHPR